MFLPFLNSVSMPQTCYQRAGGYNVAYEQRAGSTFAVLRDYLRESSTYTISRQFHQCTEICAILR